MKHTTLEEHLVKEHISKMNECILLSKRPLPQALYMTFYKGCLYKDCPDYKGKCTNRYVKNIMHYIQDYALNKKVK